MTAYALNFSNDAREFVEVDESVINSARDFLIKQQRADGSWNAGDGSSKEATRANAILTSYIARILASVEAKSKGQAKPAPGEKEPVVSASLKRALDYLARHFEEVDDAYMLSSYALAAIAVGDTASASRAIQTQPNRVSIRTATASDGTSSSAQPPVIVAATPTNQPTAEISAAIEAAISISCGH